MAVRNCIHTADPIRKSLFCLNDSGLRPAGSLLPLICNEAKGSLSDIHQLYNILAQFQIADRIALTVKDINTVPKRKEDPLLRFLRHLKHGAVRQGPGPDHLRPEEFLISVGTQFKRDRNQHGCPVMAVGFSDSVVSQHIEAAVLIEAERIDGSETAVQSLKSSRLDREYPDQDLILPQLLQLYGNPASISRPAKVCNILVLLRKEKPRIWYLVCGQNPDRVGIRDGDQVTLRGKLYRPQRSVVHRFPPQNFTGTIIRAYDLAAGITEKLTRDPLYRSRRDSILRHAEM